MWNTIGEERRRGEGRGEERRGEERRTEERRGEERRGEENRGEQQHSNQMSIEGNGRGESKIERGTVQTERETEGLLLNRAVCAQLVLY